MQWGEHGEAGRGKYQEPDLPSEDALTSQVLSRLWILIT